MASNPSPKASTTHSSLQSDASNITPSKRKGSPLSYKTLSESKAQSTPNLLPGPQHADSFLETPVRSVAHKRAKSASRSPRADAVANDGDANTSPRLRTPKSCSRKELYKSERSRLNHLRICQDSNCKVRLASMQASVSDEDDARSIEAQEQQIEDVFTTILPRNQAEPTRFSLGNDPHPSSGESLSPKSKSGLSAESFEATGNPHLGSPEVDEAADLGPDHLHCETPPGQDEPDLETSPERLRNKSPVDTLIMHEEFQAKFNGRLTVNDQEGCVYIMTSLDKPGLCKIGRSKGSKLRANDIKNSCGLNIQLVYSRRVDFYVRTESLIQAYLSDLCRPYDCHQCGKTHQEWFEISKESAEAAVKRWIGFMCRERPYNSGLKELKPFWSAWLKKHNLDSAETHVDNFRTKWDRIISPSKLDHFEYKWQVLCDWVQKFFWPAYATLAWTVAFIALQHPIAFLLMATSAVGIFISMSHDIRSRNASTKS